MKRLKRVESNTKALIEKGREKRRGEGEKKKKKKGEISLIKGGRRRIRGVDRLRASGMLSDFLRDRRALIGRTATKRPARNDIGEVRFTGKLVGKAIVTADYIYSLIQSSQADVQFDQKCIAIFSKIVPIEGDVMVDQQLGLCK